MIEPCGRRSSVIGMLRTRAISKRSMKSIARMRCFIIRNRVNELVDFEKVEPREFWRRATREALAESGYDPNPIIDALFDQGDSVAGHIESLTKLALVSRAAESLAAAAVFLAASLGYSPSVASEHPQ